MFFQAKRDNELFPSAVARSTEDAGSLYSRLHHNNQGADLKSHLRPRFFMSADNEEEWGEVADSLMLTMISVYVEYEAYNAIIAIKKSLSTIHAR